MKLSSMIYISPGNLPSKMAHSIQIAKMAQAFAQKIDQFELITSGDILSSLTGMDQEFKDWYGLNDLFKLVRLPLQFKAQYPFPNEYYLRRGFLKLSALYTCLKSPSLVYTRTPTVVELMLKIGLPVFWEWHEPIQNNSPYQQLFNHKNLIGIITTLPQIAETFLQQGLFPKKLFIAPNAADRDNFLPYQTKAQARQKLSLSLEEKLIVYAGHLYEYKGIPTLLETARRLPNFKFMFVGGWEEDIKRVRDFCQQNSLSNVILTGYIQQSNLATYLYSADVLVLPTSQYWDQANATCPLKMLDYMMTKRPMVASALPTIMTVLKHRENALLAAPDNPDAFQAAITKLLTDSTLSQKIADHAFQDVQKLTWDRRADSILDFMSEKLQENSISSPNSIQNCLNFIQAM